MTDIRIITKSGKRAAYYRPAACGAWFALPVAQAEKALKAGFISVGVRTNTPCRAA